MLVTIARENMVENIKDNKANEDDENQRSNLTASNISLFFGKNPC